MTSDIIEEIISEEIVDETDIYEDMHTKRKAKRQSTAAVMRGIVEREERKRRNSGGTAPKSISSAPGTPRLVPSLLGATAGTPKKGGGIVGEPMPNERTRLLPAINETASHGSRSNSENGSPHFGANGDVEGEGQYGAMYTESPPKEYPFR
ncbi:hypothetical protein FRC03_008764 [Tulasnella sp. 419]|nr:hypothetical protein FRC02_004459 [Tulasnella sp. 418]KAG8968065.1 hypothetical protein FRC03_008764 [Tulasnella sp. 419]